MSGSSRGQDDSECNIFIFDQDNPYQQSLSISEDHNENLVPDFHPDYVNDVNPLADVVNVGEFKKEGTSSAEQQIEAEPGASKVGSPNEGLEKPADSTKDQTPPPQKRAKCLRRFFCNDQTLKEFIISHSKTHVIYESYLVTKKLNPDDRSRLVAVIIDGLLDRHDKVSKEVLIELSENIVEIFPTESKATYYHYNKEESKNAKGKIHDRLAILFVSSHFVTARYNI